MFQLICSNAKFISIFGSHFYYTSNTHCSARTESAFFCDKLIPPSRWTEGHASPNGFDRKILCL